MPGIAGAGKYAAMKAMAAEKAAGKSKPKGKKPMRGKKDDMGALAAFGGGQKKAGPRY